MLSRVFNACLVIGYHLFGLDYIESVLVPVINRPFVVFMAINVSAISKIAAHVKLTLRRNSQHFYKLTFRADDFITDL